LPSLVLSVCVTLVLILHMTRHDCLGPIKEPHTAFLRTLIMYNENQFGHDFFPPKVGLALIGVPNVLRWVLQNKKWAH
jgi:hypothetical protein